MFHATLSSIARIATAAVAASATTTATARSTSSWSPFIAPGDAAAVPGVMRRSARARAPERRDHARFLGGLHEVAGDRARRPPRDLGDPLRVHLRPPVGSQE